VVTENRRCEIRSGEVKRGAASERKANKPEYFRMRNREDEKEVSSGKEMVVQDGAHMR